MNRSELGTLSVIEVADATQLAGELFRKTFRAEIPSYPRHFVLLRETPDGPIPIGYVHYTKDGNAYLGGGLVVSALELRKIDRETAELVRREGGFAEWTVRTTCGWLNDADAVFAYMGDAKSIRVNTRVGFLPTGHRYLHVLWKRQLPPEEQKRLVDRIAAIGAF